MRSRRSPLSRSKLSLIVSQVLSTYAPASQLRLAMLGAGLALIVAPPTLAVNYEVTSIADDGSGGLTLREAVETANGTGGVDDSITFNLPGAAPHTIVLSQGEIDITDALTITGNGADDLIVDADHQSRIFFIDTGGEAVSISGITLTNGNTTTRDGGGAIQIDFADVTLRDCVLSNNIADYDSYEADGGAVYLTSGPGYLTVDDCLITGNEAFDDGGGITTYSNVLIRDSVITDNKAYDEGGGVNICCEDEYAKIENSTISLNRTGNNSTPNGGGISNSANLYLHDSEVVNNFTEGEGGGVFNDGNITITDSTITENTAELGGGLFNEDGNATVLSSTIADNTALFGGGLLNKYANTTVLSSTISNNFAFDVGGVVNVGDEKYRRSTLYLYNTTVSGNSAQQYLAGIYSGGESDTTIINSTVANNESGNATYGSGLGLGDNATVILRNALLGDNKPNDCLVFYGSGSAVVDLGGNLVENDADGNASLACGDFDIEGTDPLLGPLAENGGPTETQALLPGSPAINSGENCSDPPINGIDQRGVSRDADCDIGAYEAAFAPIPTLSAWAMGLLGGLLVLGAMFRRRRQ